MAPTLISTPGLIKLVSLSDINEIRRSYDPPHIVPEKKQEGPCKPGDMYRGPRFRAGARRSAGVWTDMQ